MPVPTEMACKGRKSGYRIEARTCLATLTKCEPRSNLCSRFVNKLANHLHVVSRHDHFLRSISSTLWPVKGNSDISCAHEKLRAIAFHERSVSATFLFSKDLGTTSVSKRMMVVYSQSYSHRFGPGTF